MPSIQQPKRRSPSIGLTQAYEFRDFASKVAHALMAADSETLETETLRARGLKDANAVWQASQDETRVCRGVGKPKAKKPRPPIAPITPAA